MASNNQTPLQIQIATSQGVSNRYVLNEFLNYKDFKKKITSFQLVEEQYYSTTASDKKVITLNPKDVVGEVMKRAKKKLPWFIAGHFKPSIRKTENMLFRSLIVLDIDNYEYDLKTLETALKQDLQQYKYLTYSTASHTLKRPKIRIIIFLKENIATKDYASVTKNFVNTLPSFRGVGIDDKAIIDEASYKPNQFMFFSGITKISNLPDEVTLDEYIPWIKENKEQLLNPNDFKENHNLVKSSTDFLKDFSTVIANTPLVLSDKKIKEHIENYNPDEEPYHTWNNTGMMIHLQTKRSETGLDLWRKWSLDRYPEYTEEQTNQETTAKWKSFKITKESPLTFATIIKHNNERLKYQKAIKLKDLGFLEQLKNYSKQEQPFFPKGIIEKIKENQKENEYQSVKEKVTKDLEDGGININDIEKLNSYILPPLYQIDPDFYNDLIKVHDGLKTGLSPLDELVSFQAQSLVFIVGRPSHGKTLTMLNILINMIKQYPEKSFIFYSYEETIQQLYTKLFLINSDGEDDCIKNLEGNSYQEKIRKYMKNSKYNGEAINLNKSQKEIINYVKTERFILEDASEIYKSVDLLENAILGKCEELKKNKKTIGAIFIDYIQLIDGANTTNKNSTRQIEIGEVSKTLLNVAKKVNAPLVLGAQMNRETKAESGLAGLTLDKIRESGNIEQDANLVISVFDKKAHEISVLKKKLDKLYEKNVGNPECKESLYQIEELETQLSEPSTNKTLILSILKNRNGIKDRDVIVCQKVSLFKLSAPHSSKCNFADHDIEQNESEWDHL